jgi:hypothetical protein
MFRMDPDATDQDMLPSPKEEEPVLPPPLMVMLALELLMRIPVNPLSLSRLRLKVVPAKSLPMLPKVSCGLVSGNMVVATVPALEVLQKEPL